MEKSIIVKQRFGLQPLKGLETIQHTTKKMEQEFTASLTPWHVKTLSASQREVTV